jgi:hypothetical protein
MERRLRGHRCLLIDDSHENDARLKQAGRTAPRGRALPWALLLASLALGCSDDRPLGYDFDFSRGTHGWVAGFADYPPSDEPIYQLEADYRTLPEPLDTSRGALYISGVNRSDDLFMYHKGQTSLGRNTTYRVSFEVELATAVPRGCVGVGGAPGEDVTVKAGVSLIEPEAVLDASGHLRMNVDKGQQTNGGADAVVLGDVTNSRQCEDPPRWELKRLSGGSLLINTDDSGRAWLFVGTDSGFESLTALYYTRVIARFEQVASQAGVP